MQEPPQLALVIAISGTYIRLRWRRKGNQEHLGESALKWKQDGAIALSPHAHVAPNAGYRPQNS